MEKFIEIFREVFTIFLWLSVVILGFNGNYAGATLSGVLLVVLELEKVNANLEN